MNNEKMMEMMEFFEAYEMFKAMKSKRTESARTESVDVKHSMVNNIDKFYDEQDKPKTYKPYAYKKNSSRTSQEATAYPLKTEDFTDFQIVVDRNAIRLLNVNGEDNLRFVAKTAHTVLVEKIKKSGGMGRKINNLYLWVFPDVATAEKFRDENKVVTKVEMNKLIKEWNKKRGF